MKHAFVAFVLLLFAPAAAAADECADLVNAENYQEAFPVCKKLAAQGYAAAQSKLGTMYAYGNGVRQDYEEAVKWYRLSASQGYAAAQSSIGAAYYHGYGVRQDYVEAIRWIRLAVKQGYIRAQYNLGVAYYAGNGVHQDYKEAVRLFRLAAEKGLANAQHNLGVAYGNGEGVIQDYKEAYIWLAIAAINGDQRSKKDRDWAESNLSASELWQAKKEAKRRLEAIESGKLAAKRAEPVPPPRSSDAQSAEIAYENGWRSVVVVKSADGQGSGVIIRPNLVATNCHVVESGVGIVVYKADNRRAQIDTAHNAVIRHSDAARDLCLLDVVGLWGVPANIRGVDTLKIGESVYAIGAPKGYDYSLSAGVVSQLRGDDVRLIQTDAAISPGSSGGGLFDGAGNLVGITTLKHVEEDTEGISFAIPADWVFDLQ